MVDQASLVQRAGVALAWRPDWPFAVAVAMAWVALIALHASPSSHDAAAHGHRLAAAAPVTLAAVGGWTLMSVAMMVPVTLLAVRYVGLNSIRRRRRRAMAAYVTSYVAVWAAFGLLALTLVWAGRAAGLDERQLVPGTLVVAAVWQLTRWKRRAIISCGRLVPLPPIGWRADAACVRFGVVQARRCMVSCWPLMLLMAVTGHHSLVVMAALTVVVLAEERALIKERLLVPIAGVLAVATVWTVLPVL